MSVATVAYMSLATVAYMSLATALAQSPPFTQPSWLSGSSWSGSSVLPPGWKLNCRQTDRIAVLASSRANLGDTDGHVDETDANEDNVDEADVGEDTVDEDNMAPHADTGPGTLAECLESVPEEQ